MSTFSWLHISDLHLRGTETSVHRGAFSEMLSNIQQCREDEGLALDAVFLTGDIAFSGQVEQYHLAIEWIDRILDACGLPGQRNRLLIVPGNHDVNKDEVERADYTRNFHKGLAKDLLYRDLPYDAINTFLNPSPDTELVFAKLQNFARFVDEFYADGTIKLEHDRYYSVRPVPDIAHTVVVIGLNSAWLSYRDREQGGLLLGEKQVRDALEEANEKWPNPHLRIALIHHPLYWFGRRTRSRGRTNSFSQRVSPAIAWTSTLSEYINPEYAGLSVACICGREPA